MKHSSSFALFALCPLLFSCGATPLTLEEARERIASMRKEAKANPPSEASIRIARKGEDKDGHREDIEEFSFSSAEAFLHSRTLHGRGSESSDVKEEWIYGERDAFIHAQALGEEKTYRRYPLQGSKQETFFALPGVKKGLEKLGAMVSEGYDAFDAFFRFLSEVGGGSFEEEIVNDVEIASSKEKAMNIEGGIRAKSSTGEYPLLVGYAEIEENLPKRFSIQTEFMVKAAIEGSYEYRAKPFAKPSLQEFALTENA